MPKSASYKTHPDGIECPMLDSPEANDEPCWGEVEHVDDLPLDDDEYAPIYACQGHRNYMSHLDSAYIPEPK